MGYEPQAQPPTWRTSGSFFVRSLPFDLFVMGNPNRSSKAPVDAALVDNPYNKIQLQSELGIDFFI